MTDHTGPMQPDLDALVALAEAANSGVDWWDEADLRVMLPASQAEHDAAFIAACDPQTVLALIAHIRELEADRG